MYATYLELPPNSLCPGKPLFAVSYGSVSLGICSYIEIAYTYYFLCTRHVQIDLHILDIYLHFYFAIPL